MRLPAKIFAAIALLLGMASIVNSVLAKSVNDDAKSNQAVVLNIKGAIGPAVQDFIVRGIAKAQQQQAQLIILKMDTPGGLSKSMRGIIKGILNSRVPVVTFVAPSGARAASAGTYILYASHVAAMAPGTNLGAATPVAIGSPMTPSQDKDKGKNKDKNKAKSQNASKMKAINDARAYIRSLAQMRGRNVKWAELAVSKAASLTAKEALKKNVIDVVANNIPDLLQKINGRTVDVKGQKIVLKTKNIAITTIKPDWRSEFLAVITDPSVAYILLMIGFYGLLFEFINPGFVVPGVIGGICLLVALYGLQLLPINYVGLGLIFLGMIFIVAEAFIPSVGALGIGGVISLAIGSIMLLRTGVPGFSIPIKIIISVVLVSILFFAGMLWLAIRSRTRRVVSGVSTMIGARGVIVMQHNVAWVKIAGEFWQCDSNELLSEGDSVTITDVQGLRLAVTKKESKQ